MSNTPVGPPWQQPALPPYSPKPTARGSQWVKQHPFLIASAAGLVGLSIGGYSQAPARTVATAPQSTATATVTAPATTTTVTSTASAAPASTVTVTASPAPAPTVTVTVTATGAPAAFASVPASEAPETSTLDPRFSTCKEAKAAGYGHYRKGTDPEYAWYRDADNDGVVCE